METQVPDAAIHWLARFVGSNVELAVLSNVNRRWRQQVAFVILQVSQDTDDASPLSSLLLPTMARRMREESTERDATTGTFCLAWFPPMGIQILSVHLGEPMSSEEDVADDKTGSDAFAPSGGPSYEGSDSEKKQPPFRTLKAAATRVGRRVQVTETRRQTCSHEWRGYRVPLDVLRPFGYATDFINYVLLTVSEQLAEQKRQEMNSVSLHRNNQIHRNNSKSSAKEYRTTFAVRGSTFARPDGYCLCWDAEDNGTGDMETDEVLNEREEVHRQEYKRAKLVRMKRRRDLQQLVLPRMVLSTKDKRPPENTSSLICGKRQRSLQFLNAEGSHAVRIKTPPFSCGPVRGPITVFCVGIATEDGCFFSGLRRRYELGHMYPEDPRDALVDMSPVCLATDRRGPATASASAFGTVDNMDSDDSSCDSHVQCPTFREFGFKCECPIEDTRMGSSLSNYMDEDDDADEPREEDICRGRTGPGLWHCYVAVFDEEDSMIRIDGRTEQTAFSRKDTDSMQDSKSSSLSLLSNGEPTMDGLTIGADHCFDMSLCYGDGMGGEGEGAISELAAFKGRMPLADIESMERYLMEKHGIPSCATGPNTPVQEDEWRRQAHALIVQPPPWKLRGEPVPLRVMAKHKSVAWHRANDVTGKIIPVSRIGSKTSTGSSDW